MEINKNFNVCPVYLSDISCHITFLSGYTQKIVVSLFQIFNLISNENKETYVFKELIITNRQSFINNLWHYVYIDFIMLLSYCNELFNNEIFNKHIGEYNDKDLINDLREYRKLAKNYTCDRNHLGGHANFISEDKSYIFNDLKILYNKNFDETLSKILSALFEKCYNINEDDFLKKDFPEAIACVHNICGLLFKILEKSNSFVVINNVE